MPTAVTVIHSGLLFTDPYRPKFRYARRHYPWFLKYDDSRSDRAQLSTSPPGAEPAPGKNKIMLSSL